MLCPPDVRVKHSSQKIPGAPARVDVVVLLFGQFFVSGYCPVKNLSTVSLFCCAVCFGLDGPLPTVTEPSPVGFVRVMVSASLLATTHPAGTVSDSPAFDAVAPLVEAGLGDGELLGVWFGCGVPAGVGVGTGARLIPVVFVEVALLRPSRAIAAPQPAMTRTRPTIAPMISTQGVRWTIGCGPTALAG